MKNNQHFLNCSRALPHDTTQGPDVHPVVSRSFFSFRAVVFLFLTTNPCLPERKIASLQSDLRGVLANHDPNTV